MPSDTIRRRFLKVASSPGSGFQASATSMSPIFPRSASVRKSMGPSPAVNTLFHSTPSVSRLMYAMAPTQNLPSGGDDVLVRADGFQVEGGGDQRLGVGRLRRFEDLARGPAFHHLAVTQHHHLIGQRPHHLEVVADEKVGKLVAHLQVAQ